MTAAIVMPLVFLASLAAMCAAILGAVLWLRQSNTAEKEDGFILSGGAASEMARRIRHRHNVERGVDRNARTE